MLIGISGKKRVGKDATSDMLAKLTGASKYALAYPIHMSLAHAMSQCLDYGWSYEVLSGQTGYNRDQDLGISTTTASDILATALKWCSSNVRPICKLDAEKMIRIIQSVDPKIWSVRTLMQTLGTDIVVRVIPNYWLDAIPDGDVIVTDVRQDHEAKYLRSWGASLVFVYKDTGLVDNHSTEIGLVPQPDDLIIRNDGSLLDLFNKVQTTHKELKCLAKTNPK